MRTVYDRLAKDLIEILLRPACRTITKELEVSAEPQRLDLYCEADPARLAEIGRFELLQRMVADGPCAFEFFHHPPSVLEVIRSLRKLFVLRQAAKSRGQEPTLWLVSGGRPGTVFAEFPSFSRSPIGLLEFTAPTRGSGCE
jgi:hypothetical protein